MKIKKYKFIENIKRMFQPVYKCDLKLEDFKNFDMGPGEIIPNHCSKLRNLYWLDYRLKEMWKKVHANNK